MGRIQLLVRCRKHPRYRALRAPRKTKKNPEGCRICQAMWNVSNMLNRKRAVEP